MVAYRREELITATQFVRNFSDILKKVSTKELKRAVVIKNNKPEAVLINIDEYEKLQESFELLKKLYLNKKR